MKALAAQLAGFGSRLAQQAIRWLVSGRRRHILAWLVGNSLSRMLASGRRVKPGPITVAGLLGSTVGLGRGARLALDALRRLGYETRSLDTSRLLFWHRQLERERLGEMARPDEGGVLLIHLNPPELALLLPLIGRGYLRHKKLIGYWAWELEQIPWQWQVGFGLVDEIWVPSTFTAQALAKVCSLPIRVVPHPVPQPEPSRYGRAFFGLSDGAFIVLTMLDLSSCAERKNPFGAVHAFRAAFGAADDVLLLVKIGNASRDPAQVERIEQAIHGYANVRLLFQQFDSDQQMGLIGCVDVVLSLHRAEGFGLVLAEAQWLQKPVIATAYSGNLDFMDADSAALIGYQLVPVRDPQGIYSGEGNYWAEPNPDEARDWLRRLKADAGLRSRLGQAGYRNVSSALDLAAFAAAVRGIDGLVSRQPASPRTESEPQDMG